MDGCLGEWYFPDMSAASVIPAFQLYGEETAFPDILHVEQIRDRAAGHGWTIRPHRHTHIFQLFLLLSGSISADVEGVSVKLEPPVVLCLPAGCVHGFRFSADTEGWVISLPVQHYPELMGEGAELAAALGRPLTLCPPENMQQSVRALFDVWQGRRRYRRTELRARLALILSSLAPEAEAGEARTADPRFLRFQTLVATHATEHWPVREYAQALGLSERSLGRLCKAQAGLTPQALVETHLMHEASRLLAYTQMSAQSVAHALGYDDASYFSRRFRIFSGCSPSAYRARLNRP